MKQQHLIGLIPFVDESSIEQLKRASLMFDQLILAFCTSRSRAKRARFPLSRAFFSSQDRIQQITSELDWLYDRGIIHTISEDPVDSGFGLEDFNQEHPVWIVRTPEQEGLAFQMDTQEFGISDTIFFPENIFKGCTLFLNINALQKEPQRVLGTVSEKVIEVVLNHFQEPIPNTPWEAIIEWRNDSEAQIKKRRLQHWINNVSQRAELNIAHLNDEILYLMDDYSQYMKVHNLKTRDSVLYTVLTTTAEVIENVTKFNFKELVEIPFKLRERSILRLEAELQAPGREIAYVIETNKKYGGI